MTDTIERHLEGARHTIDTLDMLQARTRGNLTSEEEQFLTQMLKELKLNYVDEMAKGESAPARSETPSSPSDGGAAS